MAIQAQRASTALVNRFFETREDQSRRALVETVTREPDTTMAELAAFVEQHPELRGMTLDELLARVRRSRVRERFPRRQTLGDWLDGVDARADGFSTIPAGSSWPEVHVSVDAAQRIHGYAQAIADIVTQVTREAVELGLSVVYATIYADEILKGGGVMVNFRVSAAGDRDALWEYIGQLEPRLPFEVWLTLA